MRAVAIEQLLGSETRGSGEHLTCSVALPFAALGLKFCTTTVHAEDIVSLPQLRFTSLPLPSLLLAGGVRRRRDGGGTMSEPRPMSSRWARVASCLQ